EFRRVLSDLVSLRKHPRAKHSLTSRNEFHDRLVGLHLGQHVAVRDRITFVLQPLNEASLLHRGRKCLHVYLGRHRRSLRRNGRHAPPETGRATRTHPASIVELSLSTSPS